MDAYLIGNISVQKSAVKRGPVKKIRPPVAHKKSRITDKPIIATRNIDTNTKKLFAAVFDNKNRLNEICGMLFGSVLEVNQLLRDFLVARSHVVFSERPTDFFFKKNSPCSSDYLIDRFKLRTNAPHRVRILLQADLVRVSNKLRTATTKRRDNVDDNHIELQPHMPDSYNKYNWNCKPWLIEYVKIIVRVIVEFFRRMDSSTETIIMVVFNDIGWLMEEIMIDIDFKYDMLKKYNVSFVKRKTLQ